MRKAISILLVCLIVVSLHTCTFAADVETSVAVQRRLGTDPFSVMKADNYSSTVINGKVIPTPNYPEGETFEGDDENGHHIGLWGEGWQCQGFGLYVYDYLFPADNRADSGVKLDSNIDTDSPSEARAFVTKLYPGTFIRAFHDTGHHTMIFLEYDQDGVYVYHANWDGPRGASQVSISYFTWAKFAEEFPSIDYIITPHYIANWTTTSTTHRGTCSVCGEIHQGRHFAETAGTSYCLYCGYYGHMDGLLNVDDSITQ